MTPQPPAELWGHRIGMIAVAPLALLVIAMAALVFAIFGQEQHCRDLWRHAVESWRLGWNGDWM